MRQVAILLLLVAKCAACAPVEAMPAAAERRWLDVEGDVEFYGVRSHASGRVAYTGERVELITLDVADVAGFHAVDLRLGVQVLGPCGQADIVQHWDDDIGPLPTVKHEVDFTFDGETLTLVGDDLTADVHPAPVP